jgi:hypothetical protein
MILVSIHPRQSGVTGRFDCCSVGSRAGFALIIVGLMVGGSPASAPAGPNITPSTGASAPAGEVAESAVPDKAQWTAAEEKLSSHLHRLLREIAGSGATRDAVLAARPSRFSNLLQKVRDDGMVQCYVEYRADPKSVADAITGAGGTVELISPTMGLVQAQVPYDQIKRLASNDRVRHIRPPSYALTRTGTVNSQGDAVHRCDIIRGAYGLTGAGRKVGVISNGINGIGSSQSSGNIPATYQAQSARSDGNLDAGAEGVAMMEIVYDLAPGAALAFSNPSTSAEMVNAINILDSTFHCNVICDDLGFSDDPFFQDGVVVARIDQAVANGAIYCSSAGNDGYQSYHESDFVGVTQKIGSTNMTVQNFNGAGDWNIDFSIPANSSAIVLLQWNDPWGASGNDYDLYVTNSGGNSVYALSNSRQNGNADPLEGVQVTNNTGSAVTRYIAVRKFSGADRHLKIVLWYGTLLQYYTATGSVYGHAAGVNAIACGAVRYSTPSTIEYFSSRGPVRIDFPSLTYRNKPDLCGADGISVTGSGGFVTTFYGTSAAAPHVAAVCAQVWSADTGLSNTFVRNLVQNTAVDLGVPGFDNTFGYGRADALNAVSGLDATPPAVSSIARLNPSTATTAAGSVTWRVTFSEPINAATCSPADFTLTTVNGGIQNTSLTSISPTSGSSTTVDVTVSTGIGDGVLRLDVLGATATILDAAGNDIAADFTTGDTYTIDKPAIYGDFDNDGDVDDADLVTFMSCISGPDQPHNGSPPCIAADHDADTDVDQEDFGILQRCLSGTAIAADPNCPSL